MGIYQPAMHYSAVSSLEVDFRRNGHSQPNLTLSLTDKLAQPFSTMAMIFDLVQEIESILGKTNYARSFRAQRRYVDVATRKREAHVIGQCPFWSRDFLRSSLRFNISDEIEISKIIYLRCANFLMRFWQSVASHSISLHLKRLTHQVELRSTSY